MAIPFLTVHDARSHIHLIVGSNAVAHHRCERSLEVGAVPILYSPPEADLHHGLAEKIRDGRLRHLDRVASEGDLISMGREEVDGVVDAVFITSGSGVSEYNQRLATRCRRLRIPVNVTDAPSLCTFTLPALCSDGPLQIGITTSGMGCKLAARIRRHMLSALPRGLGSGIQQLGAMRRRLIEEDHARGVAQDELSDDECMTASTSSTAAAASQGQPGLTPDADSLKRRRLRWLAQICEHWPLERLASIDGDDIDALLASYASSVAIPSPYRTRARIILAGSGPGSPHLLTVATRHAIDTATVILSDKLVPSPVLDLIPRRTPVHIAEKFPGNADAAQNQLLDLGIKALRQGHTVLRLKQGDAYIYGRGGEEVQFFRSEGFEPIVLPAVTSAMAGPMCAAIPLTHRGVADEVRICTGVGRNGLPPICPGYTPKQTVVALMVLNRLKDFVLALTGGTGPGTAPAINGEKPWIDSKGHPLVFASPPWPRDTPCAIVERASCADQRVLRSTLQHVVAAFEDMGSRPPGLLILGNACSVLNPPTAVDSNGNVTQTASDERLPMPRYIVEEGYSELNKWMQETDVGGLDLANNANSSRGHNVNLDTPTE